VERRFADQLYRAFWAYRPLWREATRLTEDARSPYEATLAVERWLRTTGGFRYEERPPGGTPAGPPLVDFVVRQRAGYCQHFAGAMALMVRMLGIPARVAVGFTSGKWDGDEWQVRDVDAHAWVEAWFEGYGWLPFDPTPGRGSFSASYTLASDSADAVIALGRGDLLAVLPDGAAGPVTPGAATATEAGPSRSVPVWLPVLAGLLLVPPALLLLAKDLRRRARYRTRDPRRTAAAARAELIDLLRDRGADLPGDADANGVRLAVERHLGIAGTPFVRTHARARYGPPQQAAGAAADLRHELRALKRHAWERLGPGRRLRAALSLRSLRRA
jgi:hypothetical protein